MNDQQKLAYLMGMTKFAQDNNIDETKFLKVAFLGTLGRGAGSIRNTVADAAGAIRNTKGQGFTGGARNLWGKFTDTVGDALSPSHARNRAIQQATKEVLPRGGAESLGTAINNPSIMDPVVSGMQSAARRNLVVGAGAGAAGLYGLGVANNAQQAARGVGKYDISQIPLWDRIQMFLGMKQQPNVLASILNPFTSGFRR